MHPVRTVNYPPTQKQNLTENDDGEVYRKRELSFAIRETMDWWHPLWKLLWEILKNLRVDLHCDSAIPLLVMCPGS